MLRSVVLSCSSDLAGRGLGALAAEQVPTRYAEESRQEHEQRGAADQGGRGQPAGSPPGAERPLGEQPAFFVPHVRRRLPDPLHGFVAEPRFDRTRGRGRVAGVVEPDRGSHFIELCPGEVSDLAQARLLRRVVAGQFRSRARCGGMAPTADW